MARVIDSPGTTFTPSLHCSCLLAVAMALSPAFQERLHHMDRTRIQRLSLLQAEKELQASKSRALASKLASIRASEQRCSWLDHKIASQHFKLLALKSQIENLEAKHDSLSLQLRLLQNEVEELEELLDKRESFYEAKRTEMREFKEIEERFVVKCRMEVESMRNKVNLLRSSFMELKSNSGDSCNPEITAAEMRRLELLAERDNVCRIIDHNHQIKAQLQKQLQTILMTQTQDKGSELKTATG
ncbi:unnamed protein product [Sphenostylis stenocarpa]|uniref:Uncharacterized protein n=1 Tax=Sphenostylis stenocarpa TaxID=92480 RepID=A0AA86VXF2_9FABA|nr:unnamed protein product [Sphenostylis stenocarpa]